MEPVHQAGPSNQQQAEPPVGHEQIKLQVGHEQAEPLGRSAQTRHKRLEHLLTKDLSNKEKEKEKEKDALRLCPF